MRSKALLVLVLSSTVVCVPQQASASGQVNNRPSFVFGDVITTTYDGISNDLLTGGLGKSGLAGAAPTFVDPENPTEAELRTLAIYNNYTALVPNADGGGYGELFGPNVLADGTVTGSEGLISGKEFLAYAGDNSGGRNVTMMVQVPESFDPAEPCIVTAPSSGSRGVYGAIGTAGEWGLKNNCAVAYTDKGSGTGAHNLQDNSINLITGQREDADVAGNDSHFTAKISGARRADFNAATPNRFAFKHAHSQLNPEKDWGKNVLQSVEFAFYILNEEFGTPGAGSKKMKTITPENTIVIASSVSNGGGSSVRAAEEDKKGLIDGVAVSEPNVNPEHSPAFGIVQGAGAPLFNHSRSLYDYTTLLNVYQSCANLAPANATAPFNFAPSADACASLSDKGLLTAATLADQATEAQQIINDHGLIPEQNFVQPSHWFVNVSQGIAVTYANAYGRVSVLENLCGYSFGATGAGDPVALSSTAEKALFSTSNGIPPTGGVNLINNDSLDGPKENRVSVSASTGRSDQNLDGALCLRALATGVDLETGKALTGGQMAFHKKILQGIKEIRAHGDLNGRPAIFVSGRADAILPLNHTSRAYYGLNQVKEGSNSNLRYYEITNAHHLDVFNDFPGGFAESFIPLHHYLFQGLDIMFDHLKNGTPLPTSQVVRTVPRGNTLPPISLVNVPPISATPSETDRIIFDNNLLHIPD